MKKPSIILNGIKVPLHEYKKWIKEHPRPEDFEGDNKSWASIEMDVSSYKNNKEGEEREGEKEESLVDEILGWFGL